MPAAKAQVSLCICAGSPEPSLLDKAMIIKISRAGPLILYTSVSIHSVPKTANVVSSVSYCMVCVYVREDNPRALASGLSPVHIHNHGLSPVHIHNHTITVLLHPHACALCAL